MAEYRWTEISLLLISVLQVTGVTGKENTKLFVRVGHEVMLPCENVIQQDNSDSTTWFFTMPERTELVELLKLGQFEKNIQTKSDRLRVSADCSLVIKEAAVEDVGRYDCRQYKGGDQQVSDNVVFLSAISMTKHTDKDKATFSCSVLSYEGCHHAVKWLFNGKDVDKNDRNMSSSQTACSATVSFLQPHYIYPSSHDILKCEVTDTKTEKAQQFAFQPQFSPPGLWWRPLIFVIVIVVALIIVVVKIRKGMTTSSCENTPDSPPPLIVSGFSRCFTRGFRRCLRKSVDLEDFHEYANISFTSRKPGVVNSSVSGAGMYSTAKASSYSDGPMEVPNIIYESIDYLN